jgi:hypothetical protein
VTKIKQINKQKNLHYFESNYLEHNLSTALISFGACSESHNRKRACNEQKTAAITTEIEKIENKVSWGARNQQSGLDFCQFKLSWLVRRCQTALSRFLAVTQSQSCSGKKIAVFTRRQHLPQVVVK